jgi:hypothetical protein
LGVFVCTGDDVYHIPTHLDIFCEPGVRFLEKDVHVRVFSSAAFSRIFSGGRVTPRSPLDNKAVFSSSINADEFDAPTELILLQGAAPPPHLIPAASLTQTQPESLSESLKAGHQTFPSVSLLSFLLRCPSGPKFLSSVL